LSLEIDRWRARKIRAELTKLGISVGLATVSRYLPKRRPNFDQRQRWKIFLRNHRHGIAAMDFLVIPTARFRLLYTWFVIGHGRREIIHFGVTAHPISSWVVQQFLEAFPNDTSPRFFICDNDSLFSEGSPAQSSTSEPSLGERHFEALGKMGSPSDGLAAPAENSSITKLS
jgi:hypothetical protein